MNRSSLLLSLLVTALLAIWMWSGRTADEADTVTDGAQDVTAKSARPMRVSVEHLKAQPFVQQMVLQGQTEASRSATLRSEVAGRVIKRQLRRGGFAPQGKEILTLSMESRAERLQAALRQVEQMESEYRSSVSLGERGLQSESRIKTAHTAMAQAQAEYRTLELEIEHTHISAPFAATITEWLVEQGEFVDRNTPLLRLADLSKLYAVASVAQQDISRIQLGQAAELRMVDGTVAHAQVRYIAAQADSATRSFRIEVEIANPKGLYRAGISTEVVLPLGETQGHQLSPAHLSLSSGGELGVKLVDEQSRVAFWPVELLSTTPEGVWVGGLPEEISLITMGQGFVNPGELVEAVATQSTNRP